MVGRTSSAIGLIAAAVLMVIIGYASTLNVYQEQGAYIVFYAGRYYLGIACIVVGGILFLAGVALPFVWPTQKTKTSQLRQSTNEFRKGKEKPTFQTTTYPSRASNAASRVEQKIKALSMQSTCGAESIKVLRAILQQNETANTLSSIANEVSLEESKVKKSIALLLNLGLIENKTGNEEIYFVPLDLEKEVRQCIQHSGTM